LVRAGAVRVAVGKNVNAPVVPDDAAPGAHITREPGMTGGVQVARDYAIADVKARPRARALRRRSLKTIRRLRGWSRFDTMGREFLARDYAFFDEQNFECVDPAFVIGRIDVARRRDALKRVTKLVSIAGGEPRQQEHPEHAPLPVEMECGLVVLEEDWTEAVGPPHIMNAVHPVVRSFNPDCGCCYA